MVVVPAGHGAHALPFPSDVCPIGHPPHSSPEFAKYPTGHGMHVPPRSDDFPAGHGVQSPPFPSELWPAGHLSQLFPNPTIEPAGHVVHGPPNPFDTDPAGHGVHAGDGASRNFPDIHGTHIELPGYGTVFGGQDCGPGAGVKVLVFLLKIRSKTSTKPSTKMRTSWCIPTFINEIYPGYENWVAGGPLKIEFPLESKHKPYVKPVPAILPGGHFVRQKLYFPEESAT